MALERPGTPGLDYKDFKRRLAYENFNPSQSDGISMRLGLLESFMYDPKSSTKLSSKRPHFDDTKKGKEEAKDWQAGEDSKRRAALVSTITTLSCPFILIHNILDYPISQKMKRVIVGVSPLFNHHNRLKHSQVKPN